MALHHYQGPGDRANPSDQTPLMPNALANGLRETVRQVAGSVLLFMTVAAWVSLLSWSIDDPSVSHATTISPRNWLGRPGAVGADLMLQTFGVAALSVLFTPMFWAIGLVKRHAIEKIARQLSCYLIAIVALSSAASSLPIPRSWPLHHGLGGIIGDALFLAASAPFAVANMDYGRPAAAVLLLGLGVWCALQGIPRNAAKTSEVRIKTQRLKTKRTRTGSAASADRIEPILTQRPAPAEGSINPPPPIDQRKATQYGPYAGIVDRDDDEPADPEFEAWTRAASSGIAARFAPQTQTPHAMQTSVREAFQVEPFEETTFYGQQTVSRSIGDAQFDGSLADAASAMEGRASGPVQEPNSYLGPHEIISTDAATTVMTRSVTSKALTYKRPSLNLLERPNAARGKTAVTASILRGNARLLEDVLADFGVTGDICDIVPGPVVTLYGLALTPGTNPARVISLSDDIARSMGVSAVRIAQRPGQRTLMIELPNQLREHIVLRDILDADSYRSTMDALPVALGRTATGEPVIGDLARMPHLLVAGCSGSGKSGGLNAMILSLLYKHGPDDCRFLMIDAKMLDLAVYNGIPHLLTPVVTDPHKAITALAWCVSEMEERYKRMASLGVRTIDVFNNRVRNAKKRGERLARTVQTGFDQRTGQATYVQEEMNLEPLPYIIIVIDEFAGLMAVAGREIEGAVARLSVAAKAAGIHLIMATERPSPDIVTPSLKANMPVRMSYKSANKTDSRAVLGAEGAEHLLGAGDMLYANGPGEPQRLHGPYVSAQEVESVTECLRQQGAPRYIENIVGDDAAMQDNARQAAANVARSNQPHAGQAQLEPTVRVTSEGQTSRTQFTSASSDALYDRAVAILVRDRQASAAQLQRRLNINSTQTAALLYRLQTEGIVGPPDLSGQHQALIWQAA